MKLKTLFFLALFSSALFAQCVTGEKKNGKCEPNGWLKWQECIADAYWADKELNCWLRNEACNETAIECQATFNCDVGEASLMQTNLTQACADGTNATTYTCNRIRPFGSNFFMRVAQPTGQNCKSKGGCVSGYECNASESTEAKTLTAEATQSIECSKHEDCEDGEWCSAGNCKKLAGECGYPSNHTWYEYECCSNEQCSQNEKCINNSCTLIQENTTQPAKQEQDAAQNTQPPKTCPIAFALATLTIAAFASKQK